LTEALPNCEPVLLEPISERAHLCPGEFTSKVQRAVTQARAQILGFNAAKVGRLGGKSRQYA